MNRLVSVLLKPHWVFILPPLHLAGCIATAISGHEWMPVILSELPFGILLTGIAWRFDHPLFWFGVFGTTWWSWLSRIFFDYLYGPTDSTADWRNIPHSTN
jgi:hypothetical protein